MSLRGITIIKGTNRIHTGDDYDLIQEVKTIEAPTVQSYTVQVPGRNGLLNLTKGLTGSTKYYNRSMAFRYLGTGIRSELLELADIFRCYHGETIQIIDDDNPDYYYEGEATVATTIKGYMLTIEIKVNAYPLRRRLYDTCTSVSLTDNEEPIIIHNPGVAITPTIKVEGEATVVFKDLRYILSEGTYTFAELELENGFNNFKVSGTGSIMISFREGRL